MYNTLHRFDIADLLVYIIIIESRSRDNESIVFNTVY